MGLLLVVAGCGGGTASPPASTIAVTSTTYVTIPARSTTTTVPPPAEELTQSAEESDAGDSGDSGDSVADASEVDPSDDPNQERTHEIESGDYLLGIAREYDVPIDYLPAYNGWADGLAHALVPGQTLRIPPADWTPDGEGGDGTTADGETESSSAGECDTYTIRAGDAKSTVAAAHDVSVAELDAANANTPSYAGFVIGIEIQIPC